MTTARLINYPPVKPGDLIIENENRRWLIHVMRPTERLRATIHQELEIKEVLKSDIAYKLPINLDILNTKDIAETRNFTNPQTEEHDTNRTYTDKPRGILY
jgi:predicted house-cleaning noncanonical NTP pyrophosphatase (MazG superfamily)